MLCVAVCVVMELIDYFARCGDRSLIHSGIRVKLASTSAKVVDMSIATVQSEGGNPVPGSHKRFVVVVRMRHL